MDKLLETRDACELTASSHRDCTGSQVLKQGDTFMLVDRLGEVGIPEANEQGLYHLGTRHLSRWELLINGHRPVVLNSTMREDNSLLIVQMTTPDMCLPDDQLVAHGTLNLFRSLIVYQGAFYEHLRVRNYSRQPIEIAIEYRFEADFRDIFEIRGAHRQQRGQELPSTTNDGRTILGYEGLDGTARRTTLAFDQAINQMGECHCSRTIRLDVGAEKVLNAAVSCANGNRELSVVTHAEAERETNRRIHASEQVRTEVYSSNEQFNEWINRSWADLQMLVSETTYGSYPYAGVPWFTTPFGRDGLITGLETVWLWPQLARGVLSFLAATQASDVDPAAEAEPGKIIHEMRDGEMAALGEVPFRRYYGTVDATPLFVVLAGQYYDRTGDRALIEFIRPNLRRAIQWIDEFGDLDGDGFVEYEPHNDRGLVHQCWKDSDDSIFHADGSDARGPIAASEVQGYVYQAKRYAAKLAALFDDQAWATQLRSEAADLKRRFHQAFWVDSIDSYAIALDGRKRPCAVRNSNAGHLLYSGIVDPPFAERVCRSLTDERAFNGWGIRTIAKGEIRYNPMSYHNGSIWPHDTALAVAGLSRYGFREQSMKVMTGLYDASRFDPLHRLPELFCGFDRMPGHGPTLYPVACSPQAWAAGAVFLVLQSILGMSISPERPQIRFDNPRLPPFLNWLRIKNLHVANGVVDLALRRHPRDVGLNVERKEGDVQIVVVG